MTDEMDLTPVVKTWLKETLPSVSESSHVFDAVSDKVPTMRQQRHLWPPLPIGPRRTASSDIPTTEFQPIPIPTPNGHTPTATGRTMPVFSATKFVFAGVIVALFGGFLLIGQPFEQQHGVPGAASGELGTVSRTGSLAQPRYGHTATLLSDGRVLVVGGVEAGTLAEIWDPGTESFTPAGSLAEARSWHTATLLPDGRVLVIGESGYGDDQPASAEVWDPASATFSPVGLVVADHYTATALADGRVLIIGESGTGDDQPASAEVWDPAISTFSPAGSPAMDSIKTAILLPDGRVLVVGPREDPSASVWDPATSTFSPAGSPAMDSVRTATLLPDGRVLFVSSGEDPNTAEVWDSDTGTFGPAGSLLARRSSYEPTALPDGLVIIGGCSDPEPCGSDLFASVELWDPVANTFGAAGSLAEAREGHSATLLPDGRVLIVGGWGGPGDGRGRGVHDSAEVWAPSDR